MADCNAIDLLCKARNGITGTVSGVVEGAFEHMCRAFADAGAAVLTAVSNAFLTASTVDLGKAGIDRVLVVTTTIAMSVAVLLLLGQVIRTGLTMRGEHLAHGLIGVAKAALATACVFSVATLLLVVADQLSELIMAETFGSTEAFADRFGNAVAISGAGGVVVPAALMLIFGLLSVIVGAILFGEMLFRHAAIVVIVAVSPIAAAGMVSGGTADWWRKLVTAGVQLIFLKPVIVLVFAIGFGVAGESTDILGVLAGLVTLVLAAVAWPALARMCTWTSGHIGEAGGFTAFLGGMAGAQARMMPGRMMSTQSSGSAFDSDRATIARNSASIDAGLAGASKAGGAGGAGALGGPVAMAASAGAQGARAVRGGAVGVMDRQQQYAGMGEGSSGPPRSVSPPGRYDPPPPPRQPPADDPSRTER
ncbi:MAG: hypothetical protein ACT4P1_13040 [Sporichthyaceae bacterium]